jgi:Fe2+ transport system protein FeoA
MQLAVGSVTLQESDFAQPRIQFWFKMQTDVKRDAAPKQHPAPRNLTELRRGEHGILDHIDLPEDDARRLMELGFLPGHTVIPAHSAPGGDPRVFRVDGTEIALRRETARRMILRQRAS